jgi:hypothetical protein
MDLTPPQFFLGYLFTSDSLNDGGLVINMWLVFSTIKIKSIIPEE